MKVPDATDWEEVVRLILLRDQAGIERALEGLQRKVFATLFRFLGTLATKEDLEESTQNVFTIIWNDIEKFDRARASFPTWVNQLAKWEAFRLRRILRRERGTRGLMAEWDEVASADTSEALINALDNERYREILRANMASLDPQELKLLQWRFVDGIDYTTISRRLLISEAAVRQRVSRLIRKLRAMFEAEGLVV